MAKKLFPLFKWLWAVAFAIAWVVGGPRASADYSSWTNFSSGHLIAETDAVTPGESVQLGFWIQLKDKWHTYWMNPGDAGAPIRLSLTTSPAAKEIGPLQLPIPMRIWTGPLVSFGYENQVLFLIDIRVPSELRLGSVFHAHADAEWLVCADVCIPAHAQYDLDLPVKDLSQVRPSDYFALFQQFRARVPLEQTSAVARAAASSGRDRLTFTLPSEYRHFQFADFFPYKNQGLSNKVPLKATIHNGRLTVTLETKKGAAVKDPHSVGVVALKDGSRHVYLSWGSPTLALTPAHATTSAPVNSLWWILLAAFLGGLILNLMPCVFPVLSMKLLSLVKQTDMDRSGIRKQNLYYVLGVVLSFLAIGASLALLRRGGEWIGWGFQLQSPGFVLALAWVFFLLALQMFDYFELSWINPAMGHGLTRKEGVWGSFFTGVLAVVVASPCTAPFMGAALGFALTQSFLILLLVFLMLGLGLSFPYLLFVLSPGWIRFLPKPGAWMRTLKELMAFPLLLTSAWLVWLLIQQRGTMAFLLAAAGLIGLFFVLWLRFKRSLWTIVLLLLIFAGGIGAISFLPSGPSNGTAVAATGAWQAFSEKAIEQHKGDLVLVDLTADWCLTCKVNERVVLESAEIQKYFKDHHVVLLRGDWTQKDENITRFLNKYRRAGVPFYIVFGPRNPNGQVLPEILTKAALIKALDAAK